MLLADGKTLAVKTKESPGKAKWMAIEFLSLGNGWIGMIKKVRVGQHFYKPDPRVSRSGETILMPGGNRAYFVNAADKRISQRIDLRGRIYCTHGPLADGETMLIVSRGTQYENTRISLVNQYHNKVVKTVLIPRICTEPVSLAGGKIAVRVFGSGICSIDLETGIFQKPREPKDLLEHLIGSPKRDFASLSLLNDGTTVAVASVSGDLGQERSKLFLIDGSNSGIKGVSSLFDGIVEDKPLLNVKTKKDNLLIAEVLSPGCEERELVGFGIE